LLQSEARVMNFYIESPAHWILIVEISVAFGMATFKLYNDTQVRKGRVRKGLYGYLVEDKP
jgi:hypothetical protein